MKKIVIEILEYFRAEQIANRNTPFELKEYDDALSYIQMDCSGCYYEKRSYKYEIPVGTGMADQCDVCRRIAIDFFKDTK